MAYLNEQAEADAAAVLDTFGITEPPIDPIYIAAELGIEVWSSRLDDNVAGLLSKRAGKGAEIYLNRFDHGNRQRFTCAHELGHYYDRILSNDADHSEWDFVDYRDDLSSSGRDGQERYANGFAAALLMPRDYLRDNAHLGARALARLCEVSPRAMAYRLENLGLA